MRRCVSSADFSDARCSRGCRVITGRAEQHPQILQLLFTIGVRMIARRSVSADEASGVRLNMPDTDTFRRFHGKPDFICLDTWFQTAIHPRPHVESNG